ncbi:heavy metal-associated isoprenylated plant protein 32-like [Prosopis cineraria]|uniref:heavy metal-associated isoprenylated plant protein 32-like n=1 Tax=Prosopis cineraria TaxID=364024 RepID=UPI00240EA7AB|nr:heavy metal-associated isoprenylated plant protein 32-like [Prosopis cineraria]
MDKEEIAKIQKYVLKVNMHCDGCKHKVKKVLRKIDGVFTTEIDLEQGKVTVSGNVEPNILIKKLLKSGKHAELWGAPKVGNNNNNKNNNNNQNQLANQKKNMQLENGGKGGGADNQPKGSHQQPPNPQQQQQEILQQQLQQLQIMKGRQDQKVPVQLKDMKLPIQQNPNPKAVKFNLPEENDCSDDEFNDDKFDNENFDDDDDELDDEIDDPHVPLNKMKGPLPMANGAPMMMTNDMINENQQQQLLNALKNANVVGNGKKGNGSVGRGRPMLVQMPSIGGENSYNKSGGKGGGGNNQNEGRGNKNNNSKNGNGGMPKGQNEINVNKNSNGACERNLGNNNENICKMENPMVGGVQVVNPMGGYNPGMGRGNLGPIGNTNMSIGPMGNISTIQALPITNMNTTVTTGASSIPKGYFQGACPEAMLGNPFQPQQQQYMAAMINQQRALGMAGGNDQRFQPMTYAWPPPAVNYMYPQQHPYIYPPPSQDPYTNFFNDENTSSCSVM